MQTIILSDRMPSCKGGRPTNFGGFVHNDHRIGVFIGYATIGGVPYKVGVPLRHFEEAMPRLGLGEYEVTLTIKEKREGIMPSLFGKRVVDNLPSYQKDQ